MPRIILHFLDMGRSEPQQHHAGHPAVLAGATLPLTGWNRAANATDWMRRKA